jgi:hypothetical protein
MCFLLCHQKVEKKEKLKKKTFFFFRSFVRRLNLVNDAEVVGRLGQGRNERTEGKIYKKMKC